MDYKTLQKKNKDDLQKLLSEKQETLKELRFKVTAEDIKNVRDVRKARREIAQLLTALQERDR